MRPLLRYAAVMLVTACAAAPAGAFVLDVPAPRPADPLQTLALAPRWNANEKPFAESGERGLAGGLEFSLHESFCRDLQFVDDPALLRGAPVCEMVRAMIVEAGRRWSDGNPALALVDVSDRVRAARGGNAGAEIDFFAVSEAELVRLLAGGNVAVTTRYWNKAVAPMGTSGQPLQQSGGTVSKAEISFASGDCYYLFSPGERRGCQPFPLLLMHELAHLYGLDHADEFAAWNLDTDDDPETALTVDCRNPTAGLRPAPRIARDSYTINNGPRLVGPGPSADDRTGRDVLYPPCRRAL